MQRVLNDPNHPVTKELISPSEPADTQTATTPAAITPAATSKPDTDENNNQIAAVATTTTTTRVTRNQFEFDIALCKTERHMNTFVPKYMRELEKSGFTTDAAKIRAAEAAKAEEAAQKAAEEAAKAKKAAKPRVACSICAKLCTTGIAITNHVKACEKRKAAAAAANFSSLPDFRHNYHFVTTRRPGQ